MRSWTRSIFTLLLCGLWLSAGTAFAAKKPNIVVIWGDDIGQDNISAYHRGLMG
ncbi:MAG: arylsulfatase, partial [Gammaproteobacteria bacterium]